MISPTSTAAGVGFDILGSAINAGVSGWQQKKAAETIASAQKEAAQIMAQKESEANAIRALAASNVLKSQEAARKKVVIILVGMAAIVAITAIYVKLIKH